MIATGPNIEQQGRNLVEVEVDAKVGNFVRYALIQNEHIANLRSGKAQAAVDALVRNYGLDHTIIYPHSYMQNMVALTTTIQSDSAFYVPYGDGKLGMMDLRVATEASVEVLTTEGHIGKSYTITGPESISMHRVAESLSNATGNSISYVDVPPETAKEALLSFRMDEWIVDECLAYWDLFKNNQADFTTDDYKILMGKKSRSIDDFTRDFASVFEPSLTQPAPAG